MAETKFATIFDFLKLLDRVQGGKNGKYQAMCPAHKHPSNRPSLSITEKNGKILLKCFSNCTFQAILQSLNLESRDLNLNHNHTQKPPRKIVATYDYRDEDRNLLFQVVRFEPKDFQQRRPDGAGGWIWKIEGVRRVLYYLPQLIGTPGIPVYVVEGEKDADNLWDKAIVATTSPMGAGNWQPEYAEYLIGRKVVIIPDKDKNGFEYAQDVADSLEGKAASVSVIILPGDHVKDASDWLEQGGDVDDLPKLEQPVSVLKTLPQAHVEFRGGVQL